MRQLVLLLIIISNAAFAQIKEQEHHTVYVNYINYSIKAQVLSTQKKIKFVDTLMYRWYSSNKIIKTQGGADGKLLDGTYTSKFLSNNLKENGAFKIGLQSGKWTIWNDNGLIIEIQNWKKGRKDGEQKQYKGTEVLQEVSNYKKGILHGTVAIYQDGKLLSEKEYKKGEEVLVQSKIKSLFKRKKEKESEETNDKKKEAKKTKSTNNKEEQTKPTEKQESKFKKLFKSKDKASKTESVEKEEKVKTPSTLKEKKTIKNLFKKKGDK